jgi:radical S-adenosyl methionine domain-containing protein 2
MEESKHCLRKLKSAGMKKLNFSGGEPFLHPKELGELCRFCKEELCLESVSIVSNGSKIRKAWLAKFGHFVDILAISCDSFVEETNKRIGRGKGMHLSQLRQVREWCREYEVPFKLNSVINIHNVDEDMTAAIAELDPVRWKVFQCLLLHGENVGEGALREAQALVITDKQFDAFTERHSVLKCLVPESNQSMKDSYLILDEELRFLNCTGGAKIPSRSIREVSVPSALKEAGFDAEMFVKRGGIYNWSRPVAHPAVDMEDLAQDAQPLEQVELHQEERILQQAPDDFQNKQQKVMLLALVGSGVFVGMLYSMMKLRRSP